MKKQITKIAVMIVLVIGLTTGAAMAQGPVGIYNGVQTSEGTLDLLGGMNWGSSFALNSFGEWESAHLTVSMNYSINQFNPSDSFIVTGGMWTLVVVRDNQYFGTIIGEVSSGEVSFITDKLSGIIIARQTNINLRATGGMGNFQPGKIKDLNGILNVQTDLLGRTKETFGTLPLGF